MQALLLSSSWFTLKSLGDTALNSFTGTLTSPKLIAPLQMALGISLCSHFPHDFPRVFVVALAFVGRVAQDAHVRPLREVNLDHDLGLDPPGLFRRLSGRRGVERWRVRADWLEEADEALEF